MEVAEVGGAAGDGDARGVGAGEERRGDVVLYWCYLGGGKGEMGAEVEIVQAGIEWRRLHGGWWMLFCRSGGGIKLIATSGR